MPHLSAAVAMIENMLDPEIIILCGPSDALVDGLIRRASLLPAPLARHRGERLARGAAGPLCAARGAAALPLYERTAPEFSARLLAQG
jgi:predicted NBD/HSP70 family sugar kinase